MSQSFPAGLHCHVLRPDADDQGLPGNYGVSDYLYPDDQVRGKLLWWMPDSPDLPSPGDRIQVDRFRCTVVGVGQPTRIRIAERGVRARGIPVRIADVQFV